MEMFMDLCACRYNWMKPLNGHAGFDDDKT